MAEKISRAFISLDQDMSDEAIANCGDDEVGLMTSTVALSGAVAVIAHIDGPMLHIASCGDCVAVLGNYIKKGARNVRSISASQRTQSIVSDEVKT